MVETLHEPAKVFRELGKQLDLGSGPEESKSNKRTENCRVPTLTIGHPCTGRPRKRCTCAAEFIAISSLLPCDPSSIP
jgi:hypothetical protein